MRKFFYNGRDNTYTTSKYSILDFDVDDTIANIMYKEQVEV